jgi:hypothetical protein
VTSSGLPVLTPISVPPPRSSRAAVAASVALAVCVAGASALVFFGEPGAPPAPTPSPTPARRPTGTEPRFGAGTKPRLEALRDVLARGLLERRLPDGTWKPSQPRVEDVHVTETTALAAAGLASARWMGSKLPGLEEAIRGSKEVLLRRQAEDGSFGALKKGATRDRAYSALSASILALALAADPADGPALDRAGEALRRQWTLGPPTDFWTRALSVQAILALVGTGHRQSLGDEPRALINRDEPGGKVDHRDLYVAEAFCRVVRGDDADGFPARVGAVVVESGAEWGGERTDLTSWLMRAWLCARIPGGDLWFEKALPGLEAGARPGGGLETDFYGDPVSRTGCALLLLLEGYAPQRPFGS